MPTVAAFAAAHPRAALAPHSIQRREPGPRDVVIDIAFCGVCHSDIHQARDEWTGALFPMVPGHEIVGHVRAVGAAVTRFRPGDLAGVGCMVDSCGTCAACRDHTEQFCERDRAWTYNGTEMDRVTRTYGGYSSSIVVTESFVLRIQPGADLAKTAPLLCAGITTYSPLRQWNCKPGDRVGVVGLGGLGHMAVKLAASMGAEVTVLSTSRRKEADARRLGATAFIDTSDPKVFEGLVRRFDLIIDTVSANHDYNLYLETLRPRGAMVLVGAPPDDTPLAAFSLIHGNRRFAGSLIGGIAETQEMLDYCAERHIGADVEIIPIQKINEAYERMMKGDVHCRFVIDMASLQ
jgi:uncharacterized zinc-type alcohol dehydrogenase-like protein